MRVPRVATCVMLALAGCAHEQAGMDAGAVPLYRGVEAVTIGEMDGPPEYAFGQVAGLTEDSTGRIFVADLQANTIRTFDAAGAYLFSIGHRGQGPGEMIGPCCLAMGPDGLLWVRDTGNRRYEGFRVGQGGADPEKNLRMVHGSGGFFVSTTFGPGGDLIDIGAEPSDDGSFKNVRHWLTADGDVARREVVPEPAPEQLNTVTISQSVAGGLSTFYFPQPYGAEGLAAHGPDGLWASALSSRYAVDLHVDTSVIVIADPDLTGGPKLSARERQRGAERIQAYVKRANRPASTFAPVPDRKPVLAYLMFDSAGRLWVTLSQPDGAPHRARVYDRRGTLVAEYEWPGAVALTVTDWIGTDRALGVSRDSLGVERVVALRFSRAALSGS